LFEADFAMAGTRKSAIRIGHDTEKPGVFIADYCVSDQY
jgi:hypothetical protein